MEDVIHYEMERAWLTDLERKIGNSFWDMYMQLCVGITLWIHSIIILRLHRTVHEILPRSLRCWRNDVNLWKRYREYTWRKSTIRWYKGPMSSEVGQRKPEEWCLTETKQIKNNENVLWIFNPWKCVELLFELPFYFDTLQRTGKPQVLSIIGTS